MRPPSPRRPSTSARRAVRGTAPWRRGRGGCSRSRAAETERTGQGSRVPRPVPSQGSWSWPSSWGERGNGTDVYAGRGHLQLAFSSLDLRPACRVWYAYISKQTTEDTMTAKRDLDERTRAMIARRSSGAAGKHGDRRTKRTRTRAAQRTRALKEQS